MSTKKLQFAIGGLMLGLCLGQAFADSGDTPNFFECTGKQVKVVLGIGCDPPPGQTCFGIGQTFMKLSLGKKDYNFSRSDISTENTVIGDIKEVQLDVTPDGKFKLASVLIPTIIVGNFTNQVEFKSQLILTTVTTPPVEGVNNPSSFSSLSCHATLLQ